MHDFEMYQSLSVCHACQLGWFWSWFCHVSVLLCTQNVAHFLNNQVKTTQLHKHSNLKWTEQQWKFSVYHPPSAFLMMHCHRSKASCLSLTLASVWVFCVWILWLPSTFQRRAHEACLSSKKQMFLVLVFFVVEKLATCPGCNPTLTYGQPKYPMCSTSSDGMDGLFVSFQSAASQALHFSSAPQTPKLKHI